MPQARQRLLLCVAIQAWLGGDVFRHCCFHVPASWAAERVLHFIPHAGRGMAALPALLAAAAAAHCVMTLLYYDDSSCP